MLIEIRENSLCYLGTGIGLALVAGRCLVETGSDSSLGSYSFAADMVDKLQEHLSSSNSPL